MKFVKNMFNNVRRFILKCLRVIVIEHLIGADGVLVEIDSDAIDLVCIDGYFVIVVLNNRAAISFPASSGNNLEAGLKLQKAALKNKAAP